MMQLADRYACTRWGRAQPNPKPIVIGLSTFAEAKANCDRPAGLLRSLNGGIPPSLLPANNFELFPKLAAP